MCSVSRSRRKSAGVIPSDRSRRPCRQCELAALRLWPCVARNQNKEVAAEELGRERRQIQTSGLRRQHSADLFCRRTVGLPHGFQCPSKPSTSTCSFNSSPWSLSAGSALSSASSRSVLVVVLPHLISSAMKPRRPEGQRHEGVRNPESAVWRHHARIFILEPRGLAGIWARVRFYFELWPFKTRSWDS